MSHSSFKQRSSLLIERGSEVCLRYKIYLRYIYILHQANPFAFPLFFSKFPSLLRFLISLPIGWPQLKLSKAENSQLISVTCRRKSLPTYLLSEVPGPSYNHSMCLEIADIDVSSTTHQQLKGNRPIVKRAGAQGTYEVSHYSCFNS